jgi:hypothetical protein
MNKFTSVQQQKYIIRTLKQEWRKKCYNRECELTQPALSKLNSSLFIWNKKHIKEIIQEILTVIACTNVYKHSYPFIINKYFVDTAIDNLLTR